MVRVISLSSAHAFVIPLASEVILTRGPVGFHNAGHVRTQSAVSRPPGRTRSLGGTWLEARVKAVSRRG